MHTTIVGGLMALLISAVAGQQQAPLPLEKWDFKVAEETWGLKLKTVTYDAGTAQYSLLVEFTKDLETEDLKMVREAFPDRSSGQRAKHVEFCLFDGDNVLIKKLTMFYSRGELTGVKGDAFRAFPNGAGAEFKDVKRVEIRKVQK